MGRPPTPTLRAALDEYMDSRYHLARPTLDNDRSVLTRLIAGLGPDRLTGNLEPHQVEKWFRTTCRETNKKESSFNKSRQRSALFFAWCGRRGYVRKDLMGGVGKMDVPKVERVRLSGSKMLELLNVPQDPRDRAFIAFAINSGLRAGEITKVKIKDVSLELGEVYIWRSKSKGDDRIPITARLDKELRAWITQYIRELGDVPLDQEMLLFPARFAPRLKGGNDPGRHRLMQLGALQPFKRITHPSRVIQRCLPQIGISVVYQEGIHTLRRSAARELFEYISENSGQPGYDSALRVVASFLGHKNTTTTELYLGLSGDRRKRDSILRGGDFLPPEPTPTKQWLRIVS